MDKRANPVAKCIGFPDSATVIHRIVRLERLFLVDYDDPILEVQKAFIFEVAAFCGPYQACSPESWLDLVACPNDAHQQWQSFCFSEKNIWIINFFVDRMDAYSVISRVIDSSRRLSHLFVHL